MTPVTPFELDIQAQPDALRAFAAALPTDQLRELDAGGYGRIVLTGMGASHFAALPAWRYLAERGHPAWWVSTTQLLDTPELVTPDTLLVVTSQSGASGETTALLTPGTLASRPRTVVGITNAPGSPLATAADVTVLLHSGTEATVSTKTYLNTLAAQRCLSTALVGGDPSVVAQLAESAALAIDSFAGDSEILAAAKRYLRADAPRLAFVGKRDHTATALQGGLILKEAAKVPAEGYSGGEFRHGPLETAGPGLTAVLIGLDRQDPDQSLQQLAADLADTGAAVLTLGDAAIDGCAHITLPPPDGLAELAAGALAVQKLSLELARGRGLAPGEFRFGRKITTAL
jgi:glucosamine--fructose-6-phosphate aminotransferase (isomerizing)